MSDFTVSYRKRLRAEAYDYAQPAWYFVTICTQQRLCLFGHVKNGVMLHNPAGRMVSDVLAGLFQRYENITVDPSVVMPNHVHAIVKIEPFRGDVSPYKLSDIVSSFKLHTTHRYAQSVRDEAWQPFPGRLWQRSFHDRIIRNDREAERLHEYIEANPLLWEKEVHFARNTDPNL